jgi:hypothetical protein
MSGGAARADEATARYVGLMVTRRCNMTCGHCSVASGPEVRGEPSESTLRHWLRDAANAGVRSVRLTGGEPMLRPRVVLRLIRDGRALGVSMAITTNGFWGRSPAAASRLVRQLVRAGLQTLTVSVDRYHAAFQDAQAAVHIARAAQPYLLPVHINFVRTAGDEQLAALVAPFEATPSVHLRFYDIQAVGRARELPPDAFNGDAAGFCAACAAPAITDDGRVIACNGPAYFSAPGSPLAVGSLAGKGVAALLRRHADDPILDTIRTSGPARLLAELRTLPGFTDFGRDTAFAGMCDVCLAITSNRSAVAALAERLSGDRYAAERRALRQVIAGSRDGGVLSWAHVNGPGFARALVQMARSPRHEPSPETIRLLRRADLDWGHRARYLAACGLARPALAIMSAPAVRQLPPAVFLDRLGAAALQEGMRELIQRDTLRQIDDVLSGLGATGVLLKGAARAAIVPAASPFALRAAGDIDCYVDGAIAARVRRALIDRGFRGEPDAARPAAHHLASVSFQGQPVELHTRIMPRAWGLPERDLLRHARPVPGSAALMTLDPEGFVLHAATHVTAHAFEGGLKAAWDVAGAIEAGPIDWARLIEWVHALRVPRAFWVPFSVMAAAVDLPIPSSVLEQVPRHRRAQSLEIVAERLLFHTVERVADANPIARTALVLLLHESWTGRAAYLGHLLGGAERDARRHARRHAPAQGWRALPRHARIAWRQFAQYRRAAASRDRNVAVPD